MKKVKEEVLVFVEYGATEVWVDHPITRVPRIKYIHEKIYDAQVLKK